MNDITLEIQEAIKKSLPQHVGEVLQQRLKKADEDEKKIISLEKTIENDGIQLGKLNAKITEYQAFDVRNNALEERERLATEREIKLEIETLKYQLQSEKDKTDFAKNVSMGLVRNIEYRKTVFDSENQQGYMQGNNYVTPSTINKRLDENKSAQ